MRNNLLVDFYPVAKNDRTAPGLDKHGMELARGIEPPTGGLQNHCSAIELRQPATEFLRDDTDSQLGICSLPHRMRHIFQSISK